MDKKVKETYTMAEGRITIIATMMVPIITRIRMGPHTTMTGREIPHNL